MAKFQFVMRAGPTPGKVIPLEGSEVSIGRENSNILPIADGEVSRKHALMELRGSAYVIQDLGSTNGTFVNGIRISTPQVLNPGDMVAFGENITLLFESIPDPNATMLSSSTPPATETAVKKPAPVRPSLTPSASQPVAAPAPSPVYSGQVPAGPIPAASPKKPRVGRIVLIIAAVIVVCIILACIIGLIYIDSDKTGARWCQTLPFIVRLVGGVCP